MDFYIIRKLRELPIKRQLVWSFYPFVAILGILLLALSLALLISTTNNINSNAEKYISEQIHRHSQVLLNQISDLFVTYLKSNTNGFLYPVAYSVENIYRENFIHINDKNTNYFDWDLGNLYQSVFSDRLYENVSLENSFFYLPNTTYSDLSNLSADLNDTIGKTNYLDYIWAPLYKKYSNFTSIYICLEDTGLLRQYPGMSLFKIDRTFDPRNLIWFKDAVSSPNDAIFSSPYDARGLGLMITLSKAFKNTNNKTLGVAGADLLIEPLVSIIQDINIYKTGNIILIQQDKTIIVNKDQDTSFFDFIDLNIDIDQVKIANHQQFFFMYKRIKEFNGKFIVIVKVNSDEINQPLENVNNKMLTIRTTLILIISILVFIVMILAMLGLHKLIISKINNSIEDIIKISDVIINDMGKNGALDEHESSKKKTRIDEIDNLTDKINNVKKVIINKKLAEEKRRNMEQDNPFFDGDFHPKVSTCEFIQESSEREIRKLSKEIQMASLGPEKEEEYVILEKIEVNIPVN